MKILGPLLALVLHFALASLEERKVSEVAEAADGAQGVHSVNADRAKDAKAEDIEPREGSGAKASDPAKEAESPVVKMTLQYRTREGETKGVSLKISLFEADLPKTTKNFKSLCAGVPADNGRTYGYVGTYIHRIEKGFVVQGGDVENKDGVGGYNIYNHLEPFEDEGFTYSHNKPGMLSMANRGPNTNTSQFFITLASAEFLDGRHVVFGEVVEGMDALLEMVDSVELPLSNKAGERIMIAATEVNGREIHDAPPSAPAPETEAANEEEEEAPHNFTMEELEKLFGFHFDSYDAEHSDYSSRISSRADDHEGGMVKEDL